MRHVLLVGASGATGKLLIEELLKNKVSVIAIVRSIDSLPQKFCNHKKIKIVEANVVEMSADHFVPYLKVCDAVLSCLGHNLTFKGIFGMPRLLVTDTLKKLTHAIETVSPNRKIRVILMNTTGNSNRDIPEKPPFSQRCVVSLLRVFLPPHADNEKAADYLRLHIDEKDKYIEWVVVRPDSLTNENSVTKYEIHPSPTRNAIFDPGSTSRINVANFMASLTMDTDLWNQWKGQMPVIYNAASNN